MSTSAVLDLKWELLLTGKLMEWGRGLEIHSSSMVQTVRCGHPTKEGQ